MMEPGDGEDAPDPVTIPICVLKTEDTTDDETEQGQYGTAQVAAQPLPEQEAVVKPELNSEEDVEQIQRAELPDHYGLNDLVTAQERNYLVSSETAPYFLPVSCSTCGLLLRSHREQMIHIKIHPKECDICGKPYTVMRHLLVHLKTHHATIPYPCKFCDKGYYIRNELLSHMRIHTAEWQYRCELCMKTFFCSSGLSLHAARSHPGENHQCTICNARFLSKSDLQVHISTHEKALPFKCMFCMSAFGFKNILTRHIRRHPGSPPFTCNICGVSCAGGPESIEHALVHGIEPENLAKLECGKCRTVLATQDELINHLCVSRPNSEEDKPHKCNVCSEKFSDIKQLGQHTNQVHNTRKCNPFNSTVIESQKKPTAQQQQRSAYPSHKCSVCSEQFLLKRDLKHHMKKVHGTKDLSSKCELEKSFGKRGKDPSVDQHHGTMLEQSG